MEEQFLRNTWAIGKDNQKLLFNKTVLVAGVGGVGSFTAEALARIGVGHLILVDKDIVDITNLNRQIHATHETVGKVKVDVMKERILKINPNCKVTALKLFIEDCNIGEIVNQKVDFIVDAVDDLNAKWLIIKNCCDKRIPFISSMGTARKLDPTKFKISDIRKTSYDPLAKALRKKLKDANMHGKVPVVWSDEKPLPAVDGLGSTSFVPSVAGLIAASYVVKKLIKA